MRLTRAFVSGIAVLVGLSLAFSRAGAQRTISIEEQQRSDERSRLRAAEDAREAKRLAQEKINRAEGHARLDNISTTISGLPFIKPNTIVVTRNRVIVMYMEPDVTVPLAKGDRYGHYVWRWNINEGSTALSLVLAADTAMRTTNFGDIVKSSRVRRCRSIFETSALACSEPVDAFVTRQGQGFRIEIADTAIVNAVRTGKPQTAAGLTFVPTGRSVAATVAILYVDPNGKLGRD